MTRTRTKVSILMIRPNRNGIRGPRTARRTKNTTKRDHGRLLHEREKARNRRRSGDGLI